MRLLLATMNPGKIRQISKGLEGIPWQIVSPKDIGLDALEVEETGSTLEENARLKARSFFNAAQGKGLRDVAVLADDGGFAIDALNGEPGIYARRWAGEQATDEQIIAHTMKRMEGVPPGKRTARYSVTQVIIFPDGHEEVETGTTEGTIAETPGPIKHPGLPYGTLLMVTRFGKLLDDLTDEEMAQTHRRIALDAIRAIIMRNAAKYA